MRIIRLPQSNTRIYLVNPTLLTWDPNNLAHIRLTLSRAAQFLAKPTYGRVLYKVDLTWLHEAPFSAPHPTPYAILSEEATVEFTTWTSDNVEYLMIGEDLNEEDIAALRRPGFMLSFEDHTLLGAVLAELLQNLEE